MGAYETTSLNGERLLGGVPIGRTVLNRIIMVSEGYR